MYTQLPPASLLAAGAFNPQNLKVVGVLRKIVKPQGRLWGQRATLSSPFLPHRQAAALPFHRGWDPIAPPSPGSSGHTDEKGWHVRQVPGRNRHSFTSNPGDDD